MSNWPHGKKRRVGRPSVTLPFIGELRRWMVQGPALSTAMLFRMFRAAHPTVRVGKSAFYARIAKLKTALVLLVGLLTLAQEIDRLVDMFHYEEAGLVILSGTLALRNACGRADPIDGGGIKLICSLAPDSGSAGRGE